VSSYLSSGVDIAAGEEAVRRIRDVVASTARPEVLGGIGDFAGAFAFDHGRFAEPVLVASTDGVGTKVLVARSAGRYDTVGIDLVAMCVDDLVCVGAEPLFFLDYISTGKLDPQQMEQLVAGVAGACRQVGCALLGGEMAEHHGVMAPGEFDLAGFAVGVVDKGSMLGAARVVAGDVLVGLASPGLRSNGYTLARHVLLERAGLGLHEPAWHGADHSLADELLRPSVLYAPAVLGAVRAAGGDSGAGTGVHAAAHITGGGIPGNLARVLPAGLDAVVDTGSWDVPRIFEEIRRLGDVAPAEMTHVFNLGIGMVLVVAPPAVDAVVASAGAAGIGATVIGSVVEGHGHVRMDGVGTTGVGP
jgi:phosphoribosylformylglycinamidine cyclo-ligase